MKLITALTIFAAVGSGMRAPPVCLLNMLELDAGISFVTASIDGSLTQLCEASITLDDPDFLPVSYTFDASQCDSSFVASFQVPSGLSAGDGYIFWQCSGQSPSCSRIHVNGGKRDPSLALQRQGYVQCNSNRAATLMTTTRQSSNALPDASASSTGWGFSLSSWPGTGPARTPMSGTTAESTSTPSTGISATATPSTGEPSSIISSNEISSTSTSPAGVTSRTVASTSSGASSGASSGNQHSPTSTMPAVNDASTISARQTAFTSTIFTTIMLTQTISTIVTMCN